VDAQDINALNLETSSFNLSNDPPKQAGGVSTGENVLVHEEAPRRKLADNRIRETHDTHQMRSSYCQEGRIPATRRTKIPSSSSRSYIWRMNGPYRLIPTCYLLYVRQALATRLQATYLGHLETDDLGKVTWTAWDLPVVHAKDTCLVRSDAVGLDALITELGLVLAEGDTCNVTTIVFSCVGGEGAPPAAYVKETIFGLEVELRADETEFVVLEFFEGGILLSVKNNTGGVDHAGAKEPEMNKDGFMLNEVCMVRMGRLVTGHVFAGVVFGAGANVAVVAG